MVVRRRGRRSYGRLLGKVRSKRAAGQRRRPWIPCPVVAVCAHCGKQIGFFRRLIGGGLCPECEKQRSEAREQARAEYRAALDRLARGQLQPAEAVPLLETAGPNADLSASEQVSLKAEAFRGYADTILSDDILSTDEEETFEQTADALGIDENAMGSQFRDVMDRLMVARVNDGRLPEVSAPSIMTKRGEVVHAEVPASLLKTVTVREQRGGYGYQGVSFRIAKGVRYSTGVGRKPRVTTHTEVQVDDSGILVITSQRIVFIGQGGTTLEMPYPKLVNMTVYTDGLDFHLSNRKKAPTFQFGASPDVAAALINAAAQAAQD
jgi:hypothetical protein